MPARSLMVLGTSSGVGKSVITAGFCRLLSDAGFKVAPFKAQNMSNNSFVTMENGEIGRAQAVQAECARVEPSVHMNPILLKPSSEDGSQVILQGHPMGHFKARDYYESFEKMAAAVRESYEILSRSYDWIVLEGAGSPVEMNLKKCDLVNMKMAQWAEADCVLVADIDRGGVFASVLGTLDLLEPHERVRIKGILINKFRGDRSLFDDGVKFLEQKSGIPVWGVLPFDRDLFIEEEDSLPQGVANPEPGRLDIAVVLLPRMSNFTDFEVLRHEPAVSLRYIRKPSELGNPDLLILPGTKSTIQDFIYLQNNGFAERIKSYFAQGGRILGICGGYQMLGSRILDPQKIESSKNEIQGLGLFHMTTEFFPEKTLKRNREFCRTRLFGQTIEGELDAYEIHMGQTFHHEPYEPLDPSGAVGHEGRAAGTYCHGLFDAGKFRKSFLSALAESCEKKIPEPFGESFRHIKEAHYSRLGNLLARNLDLAAIEKELKIIFPTFSNHPI